jgi:hypothetical protein
MEEVKRAYVPIVVDKGFSLGVAEENVAGYYTLDYPIVDTYDKAWAWADSCNIDLGVSHDEAIRIMGSSMKAQNLDSKNKKV